MRNKAMARALKRHVCIDISTCKRTIAGDYLLTEFKENKDYCDALSEKWIYSIGRLIKPLPSVMADGTHQVLPAGQYLASVTPRFYTAGQSTTFECVWLR